MGKCKTCSHLEIDTINSLLRSGTSFADISRKYKLPYESIRWHWNQGHCPPEIDVKFITPKKMGELTEVIDGAKELERVVFEARNLFFYWRQFEQEQGVPTRQTINALNVWRHAARDYLEQVFDVKEKPQIQVSVFMPFMLKIVEQFPVDFRQRFYQELQTIDIEEFTVLDDEEQDENEVKAVAKVSR